MWCDHSSRLLLQFHVTGKCNLQCKHCYRTEGSVEPLSLEDVLGVLEQFKTLRKAYNRAHGISYKGHINITGGEPFFRKDIKQILTYLGENKQELSYGVLSNGSFIDDDMVSLLKKTGVSFVQLSIDGDREMHDSLRATGDYDRVWRTAAYLEQNGIRTYISFTATKENMKFLPLVAKECRKRRITKLWSDRLVPIGNGKELEPLEITADDLPRYILCMKKAQGSMITKWLFPKTAVTMNRALQFWSSDGDVYSCSAGKSLITVDEFGQIMPCRRMPIVCGNVHDSMLEDVYFQHDVFRKLRQPLIPKACASCAYQYLCRGGARCQSYAKFDSFYRADPACPYCK